MITAGEQSVEWRNELLVRELDRQAAAFIDLASVIASAHDYPTNTPRDLCHILCKIAQTIKKHLSATPKQQLPIIARFLKKSAEHLRFISRSQVAATPWSMVGPAEAFFQQIRPTCHFIIRPTWSFNYSIRGDFVQEYRNLLAKFKWIPAGEVDVIFEAIKLSNVTSKSSPHYKQIYCVGFPALERLNCLSHAAWGHEFGHIIAHEWQISKFDDFMQRHSEVIRSAIKEDIEQQSPPDKSIFADIIKEGMIEDRMRVATEVARQGITELLCDAIGIHILGPAALAATCEFSTSLALDSSPLQMGSYPPWRLRLRFMHLKCANDRATGLGQSLSDWFDEVEHLISSTDDMAVLNQDPITRHVYQAITEEWEDIIKDIVDRLPPQFHKPYRICEHLDEILELVNHLRNGVPPNEIGKWPNTIPASFQAILNAGWIYKYSLIDENGGQLDPIRHGILFRLILKGIESSYIHQHFRASHSSPSSSP